MSTNNDMTSICHHNQIALSCSQCAEERAKRKKQEEEEAANGSN